MPDAVACIRRAISVQRRHLQQIGASHEGYTNKMMEQSQKGDNGRTSGTTSMSRFLVGFPGETCNDKRVTCPTEVDTHAAAPPASRTRKPVQSRPSSMFHQQKQNEESQKVAIVEVRDGRTKPSARCFSTPGAASANISKLHTTCMVRQSISTRAANY